jgi:hypothetical protein
MKQRILDWVLTIEPYACGPTTNPGKSFAGLYPSVKLLSDEGKVLLLTQLYLELCLEAEQALRAARADIKMSPRAQSHHRWKEQPQLTNPASDEKRESAAPTIYSDTPKRTG